MRFLIVLLLLTAAALAGEAPAWVKDVEGTQRLILRWITFITIVGTAGIGCVAGLCVFAYTKFKEVRRLLAELRASTPVNPEVERSNDGDAMGD